MKKNFGFLLLLLLLLAIHLPFINADPDSNVSWSRGPFTDEGLYSEQIRNYINHDWFNLYESDQFFKSPLFSILLFIPLTLFGTHLVVARLVVLGLVLLIFFAAHSRSKVQFFIPVLLMCGMMQFYIFHYSHFALPEMLSTSLLLLSAVVLSNTAESNSIKDNYWNVFISITVIFFAWLIKIQFVYMALLVPIGCGGFWLTQRKQFGRQSLYLLIFSSLISLFYFLIYFFIWIYPHLDFVEIVRNNQSGEFNLSLDTPAIIEGNLKKYFFVKELFVFSVITILAFIGGWIIWFNTEVNWYRSLFVIAVIWMLLEFHKLTMSYLPSRYLVSTLFSMALLISLVITYQLSHWRKWKLIVPVAALILLLGINVNEYVNSIQTRTFVIKEVNQYLSKNDFGNRPVIGPWAGTCNWESKAITFPVWKDGYNDVDPIETFIPALIISEIDEEDSGFAYKQQGIDLNAVSDSIKQFKISQWTIQLHWMKPR